MQVPPTSRVVSLSTHQLPQTVPVLLGEVKELNTNSCTHVRLRFSEGERVVILGNNPVNSLVCGVFVGLSRPR